MLEIRQKAESTNRELDRRDQQRNGRQGVCRLGPMLDIILDIESSSLKLAGFLL